MFVVVTSDHDPRVAALYPSPIPAEWEHSAGRNRGTVRLEISGLPAGAALGAVLPGTASLQTAGGTARIRYNAARVSDTLAIVVLHAGWAGTWRGAGEAVVEPRCAARPPYGRVCGQPRGADVHQAGATYPHEPHEFEAGSLTLFIRLSHPGRRWLGESSSGGGDYAAAVWVLRPGDPPLVVSTSEYLGRSRWTVLTIHPDGRVEREALDAYLAARQASEELV